VSQPEWPGFDLTKTEPPMIRRIRITCAAVMIAGIAVAFGELAFTVLRDLALALTFIIARG
jgi:hypothetical protein